MSTALSLLEARMECLAERYEWHTKSITDEIKTVVRSECIEVVGLKKLVKGVVKKMYHEDIEQMQNQMHCMLQDMEKLHRKVAEVNLKLQWVGK